MKNATGQGGSTVVHGNTEYVAAENKALSNMSNGSNSTDQVNADGLMDRTKLDSAKGVWEKSVSSLQAELDPQVFDAYIQPLSFTSYNNISSEIVISAPSKFVCEHVDAHYREKIVNVVKNGLGAEHGVRLKLVVDKALPQKTLAQKSMQQFERSSNQPSSHIVVKKLKVPPLDKQPDRSTEKAAEKVVDAQAARTLSGVNPRYTFANFVVGSSNQFCHAAAQRVADEPGKTYNPLFIYGGVGLGKTHLLHAIGNLILDKQPEKRVLYVSAETFMNELIACLRSGKMDEFKARFRNIEVLLIDDIQFISGNKERTQEEFFHTFNALYAAKHQIVITSDRTPQDLTDLEDRLTTRFSWGLIADMQAPDFETRAAILNKKAASENIAVPQDTIHYIAENFSSNVRELEGALTRVIAVSTLQNCPITPELAPTVLQSMLQPKKVNVTVDDIKIAVSGHFGLKVSDLSSKRRTRNLSFPRHIAMYLCRKHTTASYPEIGQLFGGRDHSSVIHAANVVSRKLAADLEMKSLMEKIEQRLFN